MRTKRDTTFAAGHRRAFTLIELLVVIGVIFILMSMLLFGIAGVRAHARKVVAKTEVAQIAAAWKHYYSEYNRWPTFAASTDPIAIAPDGSIPSTEGDALTVLRGTTLCQNNPRRVPFAQFNRENTDATPVSPWGDPTMSDADTADESLYYVMFDSNFDNVMNATVSSLGDRDWQNPLHTNVMESVIVWTVNKDLGPEDEQYIVGSWTP